MGRINSFCFFRRLFFIVLFVYINSEASARSRTAIPIGIIHEQSDLIQHTIRCAIALHTKESSLLEFQLLIDVINTADVFKLSKLVCGQFGRGHLAMVVAVHPDSFDTLYSYANTFNMPFITPSFPEKVLTSGNADFAVSILPDYHKAVIDTVIYYGWKNVIYLYDSDDGMLRLQQLFKSLFPGKQPYFEIAHVRRVSNSAEVVAYLRQIEKVDRWAKKYIILDSSTLLAKETIIAHVHDLTLGRRTYHYLFSGLVMDDVWEKNIKEYGSINMTGFRVMDHSKNFVKNALSQQFKMKTISANYALMFDAAHTLMSAYERIKEKDPTLLNFLIKNNSTSRFLDCESPEITTLRDGKAIVDIIKKTQIEGLSGLIKFDEKGIRRNFTLHIVQNTPAGEMLPVATWYDYKGLKPLSRKLISTIRLNRTKTYTMVAIHETPYFMVNQDSKSANASNEDNFSGFCVDLVHKIAEKLEIKIRLELSKDGKYGSYNNFAGWDGMIGQLVRKEADMVISPLLITAEREAVVDFSKSFLSFDMIKPGEKRKPKIKQFDFFKPFSTNTWYLIGVCILGVSFVLYLVSRVSPLEWKVIVVDNATLTEQNHTPATMTTVVNEFSFLNSVWFTLGTLMQQGSTVAPKSFSGRIASAVWSFFALILICTYIASMTSQMTIEGIGPKPVTTYKQLQACPRDAVDNSENEIDETTGQCEKLDDEAEKLSKSFCNNGDVGLETCDLVITGYKDFKDFAVAFTKGSKLREGVNLALSALKKEGVLSKLTQKWLSKEEFNYGTFGGSELTLWQMAGLFYSLISGCALALVAALVEFCSKKSNIKANITMGTVCAHANNRPMPQREQSRAHRQRPRPRDPEPERTEWSSGSGTAVAAEAYTGLTSPTMSTQTFSGSNLDNATPSSEECDGTFHDDVMEVTARGRLNQQDPETREPPRQQVQNQLSNSVSQEKPRPILRAGKRVQIVDGYATHNMRATKTDRKLFPTHSYFSPATQEAAALQASYPQV